MASSISGQIAKQVGEAVKRAADERRSSWWFSRHMAAASRAVSERIPLVDLLLHVRDARIPLSSECQGLHGGRFQSKTVVVLNKMDLANSSQTKEWVKHFEMQNCHCFAVNAHNSDNIKQFLNYLQARLRELKKSDYPNFTATIMLVGIPNVGKSALANSLHKIGRISAAEKGKLKHTVVSPDPCETKDIRSLKIASRPNVYVLDTPGILPPSISDIDICSKLALTGAISDHLVGVKELAQYFLSVLNSSEEYRKWEKLLPRRNDCLVIDSPGVSTSGSHLETKKIRRHPSDHTQDFIVQDVRRTLFEEISSHQSSQDVNDSMQLIGTEMTALREAFRISLDSEEESCLRVSQKLLDLYRTGRLGHYTLDNVPDLYHAHQ
ncbi:hypothetical protein MLD38_037421 [Melastoma candidum]|uniref:Uncharacterized protein n=1 Tax=Melastoma candidum TaxID=119954 RepID=A0ACB9LM04_9MYRT|nr:hypothetical protein MLD38_037421 [Melastoma candidum]